MAQLLAAGGAIIQGSVAAYLGEMLPQDYIVVADAMALRRPLDAVVVGPQGLVMLQVVDWSAVGRPAGRAPSDARVKVRERDLAASARQAVAAMRAFLRDEFPSLSPLIRHFHVVREPDAEFAGWKVLEASGIKTEPLAETLMSSESFPDASLAEEKTREAVALALRDRRLSPSQRASKPFIFRSGGVFGAGTKVWTIRAAVKYMDRHPEDGIHHLRNGSLANWLADIGAPHLAELARAALLEAKSDYRMALETFLAGTGLVTRPKLIIRPKRVDLGYIIEGESSSRTLQIRRGCGYFFGELETSDPWLRVEPKTFHGEPVRAMVTVETGNLLIRSEPYQAEVYVNCGAKSEPVAIPVRFRVVAMPSRLNMFLFRPAIGLLLAGILGAGIGLLWGFLGVGPKILPAGWTAVGLYNAWIPILGLLWAVLGLIWGTLLPPAWPIHYAVGRWLIRIVVWAVVLSAITAASLAYWQMRAGDSVRLTGPTLISAGLYGLAAAIVPAVFSEAIAAKRTAEQGAVKSPRRRKRLIVLSIALVLLLLVILLGPYIADRTWQRFDVQGVLAVAQGWVEDGWQRLNNAVNDLLDWLYLRYYDRRAPSQPTPTALPTSVSTGTLTIHRIGGLFRELAGLEKGGDNP